MTRNKTTKGEDSHGGKSYCRCADSPEDGVRERRNGIETPGGRCSLEGGGLMLGLVVLIIFAAYLLASGIVVWLAARWAKKRNRRPWIWGGLAAFAMYNLVFWDLIPTLAMHKYYCATEAGFWIYKTPEQWAKENPGVLETLKPYPRSKIYGDEKVEFDLNGGTVRQYNDRFGLWSKRRGNLGGLLIDRGESGIVDVKTKEFLVYTVRFQSGPRGAGIVWKSWLNQSSCNHDEAVKNAQSLRGIMNKIQIKE